MKVVVVLGVVVDGIGDDVDVVVVGIVGLLYVVGYVWYCVGIFEYGVVGK